jgi:hypothetical protein
MRAVAFAVSGWGAVVAVVADEACGAARDESPGGGVGVGAELTAATGGGEGGTAVVAGGRSTRGGAEAQAQTKQATEVAAIAAIAAIGATRVGFMSILLPRRVLSASAAL